MPSAYLSPREALLRLGLWLMAHPLLDFVSKMLLVVCVSNLNAVDMPEAQPIAAPWDDSDTWMEMTAHWLPYILASAVWSAIVYACAARDCCALFFGVLFFLSALCNAFLATVPFLIAFAKESAETHMAQVLAIAAVGGVPALLLVLYEAYVGLLLVRMNHHTAKEEHLVLGEEATAYRQM